MKKKGFVLLETLVVLMVVTLALSILLSSYSLITRKTNEKLYYDKTSDIYLLYSISRLGVDTKNSYSKMNNVVISIDNCEKLENMTGISLYGEAKDGKIAVCKQVFNSVGLKKIYVVNDVYKSLADKFADEYFIADYKDNAVIKEQNAVSIFDNGTIEYMKTLEKCYDSENVYNTKTLEEITDSEGNTKTIDKYTSKGVKEDKNCVSPIKYMIGVFYRNGKYYYASIVL